MFSPSSLAEAPGLASDGKIGEQLIGQEHGDAECKSDYYDGGMHRYDENQLFRKGPSGPCWWNGHHLNSSTVAY